MGDGELILLVEDNDMVRKATVSRLESLGFAILEAKTGPEAIASPESGAAIVLMFSDIVMPDGMTGYEVAERVRSTKPDLEVLLTSGYSDMQLAVSETVREIKGARQTLYAATARSRTASSARHLTASG